MLLVFRRYASGFVYFPWMMARAGVEVDVVAAAGHPVRRSRHVRRVFTAAANDEAFRATVSARLATGEYALLLAMDEPGRDLLYRGERDAAIEPYLPVPRANPLREAFSDKERFLGWCERNGVPVPQTRVVATADEGIAFAAEWDFPVVLKGAVGMGGKAVRVCGGEDEVRVAYRELAAGGGHVLAQRFVRGAVGSCSLVAWRGRVGAWTASEKWISLADGLGPSAVRRLRNDAELGRLVTRIAAAGEVTGITGFDWIEGAPGEFLVIDPHFGRCTPPAAISDYSGVDVGAAVRGLLEGDERVQAPRNEGLIVAMYPQFVELAMQGGLWTLLRRANPLSPKVRYHVGPAAEAGLTLRLGASYVAAGLKVRLGRWRQRWWPRGRRGKRFALPAAELTVEAKPRSQTMVPR